MRSSPSCSRSSEVFVAGEGSTRIDIRSIWFLLLYASEFLQRLTREDRERLLRGQRDNDLLDALADVLAERVERRGRTMLARGYRRRIEPLTRVRGRIEHLGTARGQLMQSGRVLCRYDEQKVDLPRYRSMLVTLRRAARRAVTGEVRRRCLSTAQMLERSGVSPVDPTPAELAEVRRCASSARRHRGRGPGTSTWAVRRGSPSPRGASPSLRTGCRCRRSRSPSSAERRGCTDCSAGTTCAPQSGRGGARVVENDLGDHTDSLPLGHGT